MEKEIKVYNNNSFGKLVWFIFNIATAMVGYHMHGSIFYSIFNFIFSPIAWIYWLLTHSVNLTTIKETFSFFLQ